MNQPAVIASLLLISGLPTLAAGVLTLEEAVQIATQQNRTVQSSALAIGKASDQLAATRTRQLPNFSTYVLGAQQLTPFRFTIEKGSLGEYNEGPLPSNDVDFTTPRRPTGYAMNRVSQPLTGLIRIRRNMDTLKTGVELAQEDTRTERQKVANEVKKVYYSLQQVDASLRAVRETAALYAEVEKLTSNYVMQEVALRGDLLQARQRVAATEQMEQQLLDQEAAGKEQLNRLLGRDIFTDFEVQPVLEATGFEPALDTARVQAMEKRPEIRQAALRVKQAEQDLRAKKAERIPDISAEFNNLLLLNYGTFLPSQSNSIGVSLTWEPFDWGRKKHEAAEKERTMEQAIIARQEAESRVLQDVNDKFRQLRYRRGELRVARLAQEGAAEDLRVAKNKFAVQAVLVKDVLQAQVGLEESNAEYQQALTSFWNARADFERALGEDQ